MEEVIEIPEGITATVEGNEVKIVGKLGELKKRLIDPTVKKELKDNKIILTSKAESRKEKKMVKTYKAHINNMIKGVTEGFEYQLKVVFTHFPMTVKVEGDKVRIDNFIGERAPRFSKIVTGAEVKVAKQDVTITGIDLRAVSQTAANMENKTRVVGRDNRVFQDGIYITKKGK